MIKRILNIVVIGIILMTSLHLSAQELRMVGGLNLSNMILKNQSIAFLDDIDLKGGFHVGALADIPLSKRFSIESGALLSTKGYKATYDSTLLGGLIQLNYKGRLDLLYLDLPVTARYNFKIGNLSMFYAFGTYLGVGLSGRSEITLTAKDNSNFVTEEQILNEDIDWGTGENDHLKRFEIGIVSKLGVELKSFVISSTYHLGLTDVSESFDIGDTKINNQVFKISLGYIINKTE